LAAGVANSQLKAAQQSSGIFTSRAAFRWTRPPRGDHPRRARTPRLSPPGAAAAGPQYPTARRAPPAPP